MSKKSGFWISLIALGSLTRLLPHLPNFTAVFGIALLAGYAFRGTPKGFILAALPMLIGDFFWSFSYGLTALPVFLVIYLSLFAVYQLGTVVSRHSGRTSFSPILITSLVGPTLFYLLTNTAVALFTPLYPSSLSGVGMSLIAAIPFFKSSLLSTLAFSWVFFPLYRKWIETAEVTHVRRAKATV